MLKYNRAVIRGAATALLLLASVPLLAQNPTASGVINASAVS